MAGQGPELLKGLRQELDALAVLALAAWSSDGEPSSSCAVPPLPDSP